MKNETYIYIRIMLKNSKVLDVQWQYITAQLAYVQGRDLGRFVFKQAWNCVSLHLRLVDSDVECSRTALNSFTRRARTMLAPMDSESLTVPLALEGSEERSSSQHRERERERICVAKLRSRPTDGAQTDAAWYTLLAGLGKIWLSERLMKLWVFPVQEPFCRFFTDFQPHLVGSCWPKMPVWSISHRCFKDESSRATPELHFMLTSIIDVLTEKDGNWILTQWNSCSMFFPSMFAIYPSLGLLISV